MTDTTLDKAAAVLSDHRYKARQLAAVAGLSLPTVYDYRSGYRDLNRAPYAVVIAWAGLFDMPSDPDQYAAAYSELKDATPGTLWDWISSDTSRLHEAVIYYSRHTPKRVRRA